MELEIISFTPGGGELGRRLEGLLRKDGLSARHTNPREARMAAAGEGALGEAAEKRPPLTLDDWVRRGFGLEGPEGPARGLIFIGAAGIAVRGIAPYLVSKTRDPAVVVVDEQGQFAIPILSGHIGGANELARRIGRLLGARPVITTATDVNGFFAVDEWASQKGLVIINPRLIKAVSARLLAGQTVLMAADFPVEGQLPKGVELAGEGQAPHIRVSCRRQRDKNALVLVPRKVVIGLGCRRDTPAEIIRAAAENALAAADIYPQALSRAASIDLKAAEPGLLEYCRETLLPFQTYSAAELAAVPGEFTSSDFVSEVTGVDNVCERSAVLASRGRLLLPKQAAAGVTAALAIEPYKIDFVVKE